MTQEPGHPTSPTPEPTIPVTPLPEPTVEAPGAPTQSIIPTPDNHAQVMPAGPATPEPAVTPVEVPPAPSEEPAASDDVPADD